MKNQAVNPYLPSYEYIPDGEPHVFGDRIYLFGSHDRFNGDEFCLNDYMCWSAPVQDVSDWKCEGVIYRREQDPLYQAEQNNRMFAPDVQRGADGRYYLYYAFDFTGVIAVAVCDAPAGAYQYYGHVRYPDGTLLGKKADDMFQYDPGVLADDTGRVFLYTGFCMDMSSSPKFSGVKPNKQGAMVTELERDMVTVKSAPKFILPCNVNAAGTGYEGHAFFEAPSMRKVNGRYYFLYSSEHGHELCYATSTAPNSGFVFGGTLISNGDIFYQGRTEPLNYTGTNHGSIACVNGQWYVFYHRQTNRSPFSRQGCAERIEILPDGRILQVEITSQGLNGKPLRCGERYSASIACCLMSKRGACAYSPLSPVTGNHPYLTQTGGDRECNPDQYIANMTDGSVAGFRYFDITADIKAVRVRVRGNGGALQIFTELNGGCVGEAPLQASAKWADCTVPVDIRSGTHAVWLKYAGGGAIDVESFCFTI